VKKRFLHPFCPIFQGFEFQFRYGYVYRRVKKKRVKKISPYSAQRLRAVSHALAKRSDSAHEASGAAFSVGFALVVSGFAAGIGFALGRFGIDWFGNGRFRNGWFQTGISVMPLWFMPL